MLERWAEQGDLFWIVDKLNQYKIANTKNIKNLSGASNS